MADGFDVDPEAILKMSQQLGESVEPMLDSAGGIPEADAGIMTPVIEKAVTMLMEAIGGYACNIAGFGQSIESSALQYHQEDLKQQAELAQVMMQLSPDEAAAQVADAPGSTWGELQAEQDQKWKDLYGLPGANPPEVTTTPGSGDDALRDLLVGPLSTDPNGGGTRGD